MVHKELPLIEFSAFDRCDRCGAQAYTLARRADVNTDLLFCLHHRREHFDNLIDEGWEVIDDYEAMSRLADGEGIVV